MRVSSFLFGGLILSLGAMARAQCTQFVPVHEIISSSGGVLTIDDEAGSRQILAQTFNSADCDVNPFQLTGDQFNDNYTIMGQRASDPNGCEIKNIGGVPTMDSVQAIVVKTNGWTLDDLEFYVDDLDASSSGWQEAISVLGFRDGAPVSPTVTLASPTTLTTKTYNIPSSVMSLIGLGSTSSSAPGAEYLPGPVTTNCPFEDSVEARRCRATINFSGPIDTLAIFYAVIERGPLSSQSGAFFSELRMTCGCRCRQTNPGTRMTFSPVPGVSGECVQRQISSPRNECDVLGTKWCTNQGSTDYILSGGLLPSGNFGCTTRDSSKVSYVDEFTPVTPFGPVI